MTKPYVLSIELPKLLSNLVIKNPGLSGSLGIAISNFSIWLADNKTPFFFDYTDHGIAHVNNVLISVESLISKQSWELLTPEDGVAIVSAVLLHDCAMHLSSDGFFNLLKQGPLEYRSNLFPDEELWSVEYAKFEQEASRWDAEKLLSVFGDTESAQLLGESKSLSERQKLLVGEFLRRHHARLAHEIALNGVPGFDADDKFSPFSSFEKNACDLYGFLARSHNMDIRAAADVIPKIRRRQYLEVHAPYVMALLRIADYIQIDSARAPTQILQLRGLKSPISRQEWAKHHAVLELNTLGDDPEALNVIANPNSVQIFCGLKALFKDLQRELDQSWAVLGEIYGRVSELDLLGLRVRRLYSNLDDVEAFEREHKPPYIPKEIRLSTASAELLHLLVGPLYGNEPSIGVRELIQNSVDAILERESYCLIHADMFDEKYVPSVEVELDVSNPDARYLRVTDNGVGMTLETVEAFFLKAGASFRKSQWWKHEYSDDSGGVKVRRSGRFGVGALAAFLVGPKITIVTRHFLDTSGFGLRFDITLDNVIIQVSRCLAEFGTSVSVHITSDDVVKSLQNPAREIRVFTRWYVYEYPEIKYLLHENGKWNELTGSKPIKEPLISKDQKWTEVFVDDFENIFWSFDDEHRESVGWYSPSHYLACNGIWVASEGYRSHLPEIKLSAEDGPINLSHPTLLINDRAGRLPLNVQRSGIAENEYPFQKELTKSIADEFVRDLYLALQIKSVPANIASVLINIRDRLKKYGSYNYSLVGLLNADWVPMERAAIRKYLPDIAVIEFWNSTNFDGVIAKFNEDQRKNRLLVPHVVESVSFNSVLGFVRCILEGGSWGGYGHPVLSFYGYIKGVRLFIKNDANDYLLKKGNLPKFLWRILTPVADYNGWLIYESGSPDLIDSDFKEIIDIANSTDSKVFAYCYLDRERSTDGSVLSDTPFSIAWHDIFTSS